MAASTQRLRLHPLWGMGTALLLGGCFALPCAALLWFLEWPPASLRPSDWEAIRFTLFQALISAMLSIIIAIPIARALARRAFPLKNLLTMLLGASFIMPVTVAILGIIAVWGGVGLIANILSLVGLSMPPIFGLPGILLAHVFFNLPLSIRAFLNAYMALPEERIRLTGHIKMNAWQRWCILELPVLRQTGPGIFSVIFILCTTSFAVVLTLGGGPEATTIELAIYQAFRLEFDITRAIFLALIQLLLAALALTASYKFSAIGSLSALSTRRLHWPQGNKSSNALSIILDTTFIFCAMAFLISPIIAIAVTSWGSMSTFLEMPGLIEAILRTITIAILSAMLVGAAALLLPSWKHPVSDFIAAIGLVFSPLLLSLGLWLCFRNFASASELALPITALLNALSALPFALNLLRGPLEEGHLQDQRLGEAIGLSSGRFRWTIIRPRIAHPLGLGMGLTAALSAGDLGAIVLLGGQEQATLPLFILQLMRAYRLEEAMAGAMLLFCISLALLMIFDIGGRWLARI